MVPKKLLPNGVLLLLDGISKKLLLIDIKCIKKMTHCYNELRSKKSDLLYN